MTFRTYKIPRIRVDLDNIFAGYKAENVHICAMSCTVHPYFYSFCIRLKRIFHCIVFKSIKILLCINLCVVLAFGARGLGFGSRPRHLNFQILVIIACFQVAIWVNYHWSDVNRQYNQPTNQRTINTMTLVPHFMNAPLFQSWYGMLHYYLIWFYTLWE